MPTTMPNCPHSTRLIFQSKLTLCGSRGEGWTPRTSEDEEWELRANCEPRWLKWKKSTFKKKPSYGGTRVKHTGTAKLMDELVDLWQHLQCLYSVSAGNVQAVSMTSSIFLLFLFLSGVQLLVVVSARLSLHLFALNGICWCCCEKIVKFISICSYVWDRSHFDLLTTNVPNIVYIYIYFE